MSTRTALLASMLLFLAAPVPSEEARVVGIAFVGRLVSDLDKSVAFYEAIGFRQDPGANPEWRNDDFTEQLYGLPDMQTRMAKMVTNSMASGKPFAVYLREIKGVPRKTVTGFPPWEPGATHFGLVVTDAPAVWEKLQKAGMLRARSWDGKLIPFPGETRGGLAYMTDPDGLDIEIINQRPATPAADGRPPRPALTPPVNPTVNSVSSISGDSTYKVGDTIVLVVNFSEAVFLSTGTIQLTLETGATDRAATYLAGSGSSSLYFSYTVEAGHTSADLH